MICSCADNNDLVNENDCIDTLKVSLEKDAHRAISWFDNNYMNANLDKFQCISLDRFGRPPISLSAEGTLSHLLTVLKCQMNSCPQHDTHISNLCPRHQFKSMPWKESENIYIRITVLLCTKPLFHPIFHIVRCPGCFVGKETQISWKNCRSGLSVFVFSDYTSQYNDLLKHGNFLSLSALRIRYLTIEMYKYVRGLNPPHLNEVFKDKHTRYDLRNNNHLQQPEFQTVRYGFKSFR